MALASFYADRQAFRDLQEGRRRNALARQAGGMMASGDAMGARNTLYRGGELQAAGQLDTQISGRQKAQAEALDRFTQGLGRVLDDPRFADNPEAAWQVSAPFAERLGLDPRELEREKAAFIRDPKGWASFWNEKAKREKLEFAKGSDGSYSAIDPYSGKPVYQYQAPTPDKYEQWDPDKEVRMIPGRPGGPVAPQEPVFRTPGINPDAPQPEGAPNAPRSVRNNNPGNIEDGAFARSLPGYAGSDGRFARFSDPNAGRGAQIALLDSYAKRGLNTVAGIINRWAPPSENDTQGYARFVAQRLGVEPNQPLDMGNPEVKAALADAITTFEGGPGSGPAAPSRQAAGGPQLVRPARAKAGGRMATAAEKEALGLPADQPVWIGENGKPDLISTGAQNNPRKAEADLRKEFNGRPEVKEFRDVDASYRTISRLASQPASAAGDMSLIFAFMKMLDPGSVVREGEFANAQNTAGIPDRIRNAYNKALNGQRLSDKQRAEFTTQARVIYESRKERYSVVEQEYRGYAVDYSLDPDRISTPSQPKEDRTTPGGNFSSAQKTAAARLAKNPGFKTAPAGSKVRPFVPRTEAEFRGIKKGQWYIDDDGSIFQKGS